MRVLFPVLGFIRSGGFRVLTQLANGARANGHEAVFVCAAEQHVPYFPVDAQIIYVDARGNTVPDHEREQRAVHGFKKLLALYRFLLRESAAFDAVVASSNLTTYAIWLGSQTRNFYYIQAYEPDFYREVASLPRRFILTAAAWMSYFLPFTRIVNARLYCRYKNIRADHVVPPGLDLGVYYQKSTAAMSGAERSPVVGCIGRLERWKGAEDTAEAVALLHAENVGVEFRTAFHGVSYPRHTLVKPDGDVNLAAFYRGLDILVAPGQLQLGAVHYPVIEAMACGTSVITTGYQPADDSNAYLVPIKSPRAIADAVKQIIGDPSTAQRKAEKATRDVRSYAWPEVTRSFYSILFGTMQADSVGNS